MIEAYIPKFLSCLYHEKIDGVIGGQELRDMFHSNQINSIYEMLKACDAIVPKLKGKKTVYIGSWMGFKTRILCEMYGLKITELEIDKRCGNVSKIWNEENRYYVGHIYEDANKMSTNFYSLNDLVINPSCEHMSDEWFNKIPKGTHLILQSNDFDIPEHTNIVKNIKEMKDKYEMTDIYSCTLQCSVYRRFTLAGIKT